MDGYTPETRPEKKAEFEPGGAETAGDNNSSENNSDYPAADWESLTKE